jgi:hypothetical protein
VLNTDLPAANTVTAHEAYSALARLCNEANVFLLQ